jgi:anaerobic ribonucleoside-triphosphate reductase activating protein
MASQKTRINLHSVIPSSRVNGPGNRMVIFFQGCDNNCPGCFNPTLRNFDIRSQYLPEEIFTRHLTNGIDGITVSGGEPFLQPKGLLELLKTAVETYALSTVVYSGFTIKELMNIPECAVCLDFIDVLVDGRYSISKNEPTLLARGSTNQRFCFLSDCYEKADFYMPGKVEVIIDINGTVTQTGFSRSIINNLGTSPLKY